MYLRHTKLLVYAKETALQMQQKLLLERRFQNLCDKIRIDIPE